MTLSRDYGGDDDELPKGIKTKVLIVFQLKCD